jgi:hypothetical protein
MNPLPPHPGPRRIDQLLLGIIGIAVILAAIGLVLGALIIGDQQHDSVEAQTTTLDTGVVATVDGFPISELDWELALFQVSFARDVMQQNLDNEAFTGPAREYTEAYTSVLDRYGPAVSAFGSLLIERATVSAAFRDGFEIDGAALGRYQAEQRTIVARVRDGTIPADPINVRQLLETIELAGEDRFWSRVIPQWGSYTQATEHLFEARVGRDEPDWRAQWEALQRQLAHEAHVQLTPALAEEVSLPAVLAYLEDVAALPLPS